MQAGGRPFFLGAALSISSGWLSSSSSLLSCLAWALYLVGRLGFDGGSDAIAVEFGIATRYLPLRAERLAGEGLLQRRAHPLPRDGHRLPPWLCQNTKQSYLRI
jgi:hypothetical protein